MARRPKPLTPTQAVFQGKLLLKRGDVPGAEALIRPTVEAYPDALEPAEMLAEILDLRGRFAAAAEVLARLGRASGAAPRMLRAAEYAQRVEEVILAAQLLDELVIREPDHTEARLRLASLLLQYGDGVRGSQVLGPVLARDPDNLPALEMMTELLLGGLTRLVDLTWFHRLVAVSPRRRAALGKLALAERYAGNLQAALGHSLEALDPADAESCARHADLLELSGRGEEALRLLEPFGAGSAPILPGVGMVLSRLLGRAQRHDEALQLVDRCLKAPNLPAVTLSSLLLRRGSILDRMGRSDEAWEAFSRAKTIQAGAYNPEADRRRCESVFDAFSGERRRQLVPAAASTPRPILVLGMYRSGTTLLEQILTMHPEVGGADEVPYFLGMASAILASPDWVSRWTLEEANRIGAGYRALLRHGNPDRSHVVDKNPRNWEVIGLVAQACPDAVVIHMDRHPLDVCVSSMATGFSAMNTFAADPRSFAQGYALQAEIMERWKKDAPLPILTLRYEDLVREPERRIREVLGFIGLPWEPACLEFWKSERVAFTPSQDQVREPLNVRSIGRWRRFERQLEPARRYLEELGIACGER
ncbi:MAG: hypothetical protein RLZ45_1363 [Verrucomicrobiota bacterium]|jgi:tetratricopeptide (TPR) repeat protein